MENYDEEYEMAKIANMLRGSFTIVAIIFIVAVGFSIIKYLSGFVNGFFN